jgi:hypothetical protein
VIVNQELYFDSRNEENVSNFRRAMLNMQNIDDRYIVEWNNIRFIGKKEQDIHDFVLLKDSMNKDNNVMSLNFNGDGVSLIGSGYKTGKENQDQSVNQFEINKNNNKESVYQKELNIMSMDNLQNSLINELKEKKNLRNNDNINIPASNDAFSFKSVGQLFNIDKKNRGFIEGDGMYINPCFNKGYFNDELNIIGRGNYTECFNYIDKLVEEGKMNATHIVIINKLIDSLKSSNHVNIFNLDSTEQRI